MKYMNFKRYKFATIQKKLDSLSYILFSLLNSVKNKFKKAFIQFQESSFKPNKIYKILKNTFKPIKIRKLKLLNFKFFTMYMPVAFIFFGFLYISIPIFYTFEKSNMEKKICEKITATCSINGKINYRFFPTPRINITNITIENTIKKILLLIYKTYQSLFR